MIDSRGLSDQTDRGNAMVLSAAQHVLPPVG